MERLQWTELLKKAQELKGYCTEMRHTIHQNPEPSFKEFKTTKLIKAELDKMGVEYLPLDIPTGVVAVIRGTKPGNRITALRADIDALQMPDLCGKEYASKNDGVAHACGHDGHTAVLLGVAKLLSGMKDQFSGTVKLVFQPAEEGLGGSKIILNSGGVDDVESIVCLHAWPYFKVGEIGAWGRQVYGLLRPVPGQDHRPERPRRPPLQGGQPHHSRCQRRQRPAEHCPQ